MKYFALAAVSTMFFIPHVLGQATTKPTQAQVRAATEQLEQYAELIEPTYEKMEILNRRLAGGISYNDFHQKLNEILDDYAVLSIKLDKLKLSPFTQEPLSVSVELLKRADSVWLNWTHTSALAQSMSDGEIKNVLTQAAIDELELKERLCKDAHDNVSLLSALEPIIAQEKQGSQSPDSKLEEKKNGH